MASAGLDTRTEVDFARKLDNKPKYVVSNSLSQLEWQNSRLIKGDLTGEVMKLKQGDGYTLAMFGSPGLAMALDQLGLIDEYYFLLQPIIAGLGPTLFEGIGQRRNLKLIESTAFHSGVVLNRCQPVK